KKDDVMTKTEFFCLCLFWAAGLALFTLGVWAQISLADYMLLSANRYPNAPIILLSTGAAVTTWGFLGCLGVAANLPSVLRAYGFFQLAALIAGLAGGLSGLFYREDIAGGFRSGLLRAVAGYTEDEGRADALDSLQRALECCGADGWRDWLASDWASQHMIFLPVENGTSVSLPDSCCIIFNGSLHCTSLLHIWPLNDKTTCFTNNIFPNLWNHNSSTDPICLLLVLLIQKYTLSLFTCWTKV
uniref:Tetraspanin n=1 Tax=Cynoglossus semilaevis TaxID=244447 RepID=A0A3P8V8I7_CYNSE